QPWPSEVDHREHGADHEREDRDHLGAARYRTPPAGVHQPQDGGNQRAGVADADPEHEAGDVEAPVDGPSLAAQPDPEIDLGGPGNQADEDAAAEDDDEQV